MLNIFKKKTDNITSPVNGKVIAMEQVPDDVFANKLLGDGFAVEPEDGEIFAPVEGKVFSIFPTKHAISIISKSGLEILVHMGLDTVELEGNGFEILVEKDQKITPETKIAKMDLNYIKTNEKLSTVIVAFTNLKDKKIKLKTGDFSAKDVVAVIE